MVASLPRHVWGVKSLENNVSGVVFRMALLQSFQKYHQFLLRSFWFHCPTSHETSRNPLESSPVSHERFAETVRALKNSEENVMALLESQQPVQERFRPLHFDQDYLEHPFFC